MINSDLISERHKRIQFVCFIIFLLSCLLIINLFFIQILHSEKYNLLSNKNRIRLVPLLPKRGRIVSADGENIASIYHRYRLVIDKRDFKNFQKDLQILIAYKIIREADAKQLLIDRKNSKTSLPLIIKENLSWDEYAKISMILFKLLNTSIEVIYGRKYEMPLEFSHLVGYVAKDSDRFQILTGKTGLEYYLNDDLTGDIGSSQTEIDSFGTRIRVLETVQPLTGTDVVISIDSKLQKYVYDVISNEKAGACAVINLKNGEIMALVSVPGFDANLMSSKMTQARWDAIKDDNMHPLINRAVSAYPPGSLFKIVVAFAAISEGVVRPEDNVFCDGSITLDKHIFHCWNRNGHGNVNIYDALRLSCDCYFFEISKRLGINTIVQYAKQFGFGEITDIEIPHENAGLLPSKEWKFLKYKAHWKPYETIITGIGQGATLASIVQIANMFGKLYTANYNFRSTIIKGKSFNDDISPINTKHINVIKGALQQVCTSGTAAYSCNAPYGISGKTGSSQVRKISDNMVGMDRSNFEWKYRDHSFFVGCAPNADPKYIVAVFIEHGGSGSKIAAPIARKIFDKLMGYAHDNQ